MKEEPMHLDHAQFDALMETYLAGGLSPAERGAFEAHAAECVLCGQALAAAREFGGFLSGSLELHRPPADLADRVLAGLAAEGLAPRRRVIPLKGVRLPRIPRSVATAASILVLIGLGAVASGEGSIKARHLESTGAPFRALGGAWNGRVKFTSTIESRMEEEGGESPAEALHTLSNSSLDLLEKQSGPSQSRSDRRSQDNSPPVAQTGLLGMEERKQQKSKSGGHAGYFADSDLSKKAPDPSAAQPAAERKVIRNGSLELEIAVFDETYQRVSAILAEIGGFVASSAIEKLPNGKVCGTVVVRFPSARFDETLARLKGLGELKNQSVSTQDVTKHYVDLDSDLRNRKVLETRLLEILKTSKGKVQELLEVEKELARVRSEIERITGELKYYDNLVSLSTVTLSLREKDLGKPFEYVQAKRADARLWAADVAAVYASAQQELRAAEGKILGMNMTRTEEGSATATIAARVPVERFPEAIEALKRLASAAEVTVREEQKAMGGDPAQAGADAPVRKEMAHLEIVISTPPEVETATATLAIEVADARAVYEAARAILSDAKGRILDGGLDRNAEIEQGRLTARVDAAAFQAAVERLKGLGKVTNAQASQKATEKQTGLRIEKGTVHLTVSTPPRIVAEDGFGAFVRRTLQGSAEGLGWSLRMLVTGAVAAAPWILPIAAIVWLLRRRRKTA